MTRSGKGYRVVLRVVAVDGSALDDDSLAIHARDLRDGSAFAKLGPSSFQLLERFPSERVSKLLILQDSLETRPVARYTLHDRAVLLRRKVFGTIFRVGGIHDDFRLPKSAVF